MEVEKMVERVCNIVCHIRYIRKHRVDRLCSESGTLERDIFFRSIRAEMFCRRHTLSYALNKHQDTHSKRFDDSSSDFRAVTAQPTTKLKEGVKFCKKKQKKSCYTLLRTS